MNDVYSGQILTEKLSKLNNSQQSIETLSHWCIFHRKKAKHIVDTWEKHFYSSRKDQRVSFLYLANDILQNSRRKGSEYVNEFWKTLPRVLRSVSDSDDEHGKRAVMRLIDIWDERKVFGSRARTLQDEVLAKGDTLAPENNGKAPETVKIARKDANSIRIKLTVGTMTEKIVSAYQQLNEDHFDEDTALHKCETAVGRVGRMGMDIQNALAGGDQQRSALANELKEQETILRQCVCKLENSDITRTALMTLLKEALDEQETKLEHVRSELQVAKAQADLAGSMQEQLLTGPASIPASFFMFSEHNAIPTQITSTSTPISAATVPLSMPPQQFTSSDIKPNPEEHKKTAAAVAAEVAAKLAASTSSAQMLTSVLSSLAAEEAASMNAGLRTSTFTNASMNFMSDKRPKLEKPMNIMEQANPPFHHMQQQHLMSSGQLQNFGSATSMPSFSPPLPPTPPPHLQQQYQQSGGPMPFLYSSGTLPPPLPPPMSGHMVGPVSSGAMQQQSQQHNVLLGYNYQPTNAGFYPQSHATTPQQVSR